MTDSELNIGSPAVNANKKSQQNWVTLCNGKVQSTEANKKKNIVTYKKQSSADAECRIDCIPSLVTS